MTPRAGLKACTTTVALVLVVQAFRPVGVVQAFRPAIAQQSPNALANFIKVQAPIVALVHARVIDGTGAPARDDQTIVIRDGSLVRKLVDKHVALTSTLTVFETFTRGRSNCSSKRGPRRSKRYPSAR